MHTKAVLAVLVATMAASSPAQTLSGRTVAETAAAAKRYSADYEECRETAPRGIDLWGCAIEEARIQDRQLNLAYRKLLGRLPGSQAAVVRRGQRAWVAERDRECRAPDLDFGYFDPGGERGSNPWCVIDKTILRTIWLERYRK